MKRATIFSIVLLFAVLLVSEAFSRTFVTIGTGGSAGREGPIAQIGAGFASFLATKFNLSARERRIMMAAGIGAAPLRLLCEL